MANKFLDSEGVAILWREICNTFVNKDDFGALNDAVATFSLQTDEKLGALDDAVASLQAHDEGEAERISAAVSGVLDGAPEAFDTLKEISDYIASDDARAEDIISRLSDVENAEAIALTKAEIRNIAERVYDEIFNHKFIVADRAAAIAALDEIETEGSLVLEDDLDLGAQGLSIPAGKSITIDLGGHEMAVTSAGNVAGVNVEGGDLIIENGTVRANGRAIAAFNGGTITLGEGAEVISGDVAIGAVGEGSLVTVNGGSITAQESGVLVTSGAKVVVNDGVITGLDNGPLMGNGSAGKGDIEMVMNGGELIANITSAGYVAVGVYMPNSGSFTMNGGKIVANGGAGVVCRGGVTKLLGGEIITTQHPTLEVGKVGDSRVVVPCSAVVYDKNSKYPGMDTLSVEIGADMILNGAHEDITVLSDEAEPAIIDNRAPEQAI